MTQLLPLFPLGLVLFPGLVLPLHVFEERYRLLVRELVDLPGGTPRRFGVVAIRQGRDVGADGVTSLYEVGCTAELRGVEPYEDGRFDIVTTGSTRFRLREVDDSRPYLRGAVELLPEAVGDTAEATVLTRSVRAAFLAYLSSLADVRSIELDVPDLPDDPLVLSYLVAATVVVDLDARQALLGEVDSVARLRAELALLTREAVMLRTLAATPAPELTRMPMSPN